MNELLVENIVVEIIRKDIKNLHIYVRPPWGKVRVVAPFRASDQTIRIFVISKLNWVRKHQLRFRRLEVQPDLEFISGEDHFFLGKSYVLNVIYHNGKPGVEITEPGQMDLYVREGSDQSRREKVMIEWYRRRLKEQIPDLIEKWQYIVGVEVNDWGVKRMKTRWGSCNRKDKRIWLSLELARKPLHCVEYIIVHELAHLLERHHNDHFKSLMDSFMPEWRHYQNNLYRIGPAQKLGATY